MTEKFRIILGSPEYMRKEYPLSKQQRLFAESKTKMFFVESEGERVDLHDVKNQVDEWDRENIEEILVEGPIVTQLAFALAFGNLEEQGVPVHRKESTGDDDSKEQPGYYM